MGSYDNFKFVADKHVSFFRELLERTDNGEDVFNLGGLLYEGELNGFYMGVCFTSNV